MPFKISKNLLTAWELLKTSQWALWLTLLIWILSSTIILGLGLLVVPPTHRLIITVVMLILTAPLFAGMNGVAIKQVRPQATRPTEGLQYFRQWLPLAVAFILIIAIIILISILLELLIVFVLMTISSAGMNVNSVAIVSLLLSSIVFIIAYTFLMFTIPLIIDQRLSPWEALWRSCLLARKNWLSLFGLMLIFYMLDLIIFLTVFIPYIGIFCYVIISICLIPFIFLNIGVAYHQLLEIARDRHNANSLLSSN